MEEESGFPISPYYARSKRRSPFGGIVGFVGFLVMAGGIAIGVTLVQKPQIFSEKASSTSDIATERIAQIAKELGQTSSPNLTSYVSQKLGYRIEYDNNYWVPSSSTNLSKNDLTSVSLSLNANSGSSAEVSLESFNNSDKTNLERLASMLSGKYGAKTSEKVHRNGRDYYKLTIESTFLGQKNSYYKYITANTDKYYVITAKYPTFGYAKDLSEQLVDSITFPNNNENVKGTSVSDIPEKTLDESKIVELTKPSVVEIAHLYCDKVSVNNTGASFLKSSYNICDGAMGSGFIISDTGEIATNGHVVKAYPDSSLVDSFISGNPLAVDFYVDFYKELVLAVSGQQIPNDAAIQGLSDISQDPTKLNGFITLIYQAIRDGNIKPQIDSEKYYVKLGNEPFEFDTTKIQSDFLNTISETDSIKSASLVGFNYPDPISLEVVLDNKQEAGTDVAILKIIDGGGFIFPSLTLGSSDKIKEGENITVIGYPGLVSGSTSGLISQKSSATPTITRGIISAIKSDQEGNKLIQVDASIDHGNSGGPAFDSQGNVIGIATYGIGSQSGNYNFLRDIEDLKKLASANAVTIEPSLTYDLWSQGLNYFWEQHYRQAEIPFSKLSQDYPIHPLVASYISDSKSAIAKGEDKSGFIFLLTSDTKTQIIVGGGISIVLLVILIVAIVMVRKRKQDRLPPPQPQPIAMPQQPQMIQPQMPTMASIPPTIVEAQTGFPQSPTYPNQTQTANSWRQ